MADLQNLDEGGDEGGQEEQQQDRGGYPQQGGDDGRGGQEQGGYEQDTKHRDLTLALQMERENNRRTSARVAELEANERARMARWEVIQQQREAQELALRQEQQKNADPEPDPIVDPEAHDQWERRQEQNRLAMIEQNQRYLQQQVMQRHQEAVVGRLFGELGNFELKYAATYAPDYQQAFDYLVGSLAQHFRNLGYPDYDESNPRAAIWGNEGKLAQERETYLRSCLRLNPDGSYAWLRDPAEGIYRAAYQVGYGYQQQQYAQAQQAQQPRAYAPQQNGYQNGNGQMQQRPNDRSQDLERAVRGSAGAVQSRGGGGRRLMTEADLDQLSEREMAYLLQRDPHGIDRIMGRG
jgi:hypothetical protein